MKQKIDKQETETEKYNKTKLFFSILWIDNGGEGSEREVEGRMPPIRVAARERYCRETDYEGFFFLIFFLCSFYLNI